MARIQCNSQSHIRVPQQGVRQQPGHLRAYEYTRRNLGPYVYDDSDLTPDEMAAAAASHLDDPEGWGAAGMDAYDQDDPQTSP